MHNIRITLTTAYVNCTFLYNNIPITHRYDTQTTACTSIVNILRHMMRRTSQKLNTSSLKKVLLHPASASLCLHEQPYTPTSGPNSKHIERMRQSFYILIGCCGDADPLHQIGSAQQPTASEQCGCPRSRGGGCKGCHSMTVVEGSVLSAMLRLCPPIILTTSVESNLISR